jgi:outer membrane protein OmpA-like peptidoglycan-associated protein
MKRHYLVISGAILSAVAVPHGSRSQTVGEDIRIAQAEQQPAPEERRPEQRRPGQPGQPGQRKPQGAPGAPGAATPGQQHPPTANAPPRPGVPGTAQPSAPQRPGPATAQTPPNQLPPSVPPPAGGIPPNARPAPPAAAQTQPAQPQRQGGPPARLAPLPGTPGAPAAQQNAAPVPGLPRPGIAQPATPALPAPAPAAQAPSQLPRPAALAPMRPLPAVPAPAVANAPVDPRTMPKHLDQLRAERHETQEGNRTIIQEHDRIIIREGGNDIIRHDEAGRFRFNAREVNVERRGNDTITIALRPDGARIVTETDETGRLLRRLRREPDGREVIIIDNSFEPRDPGGLAFVVNLPAPVIRIPREVYIRETARATAEDIFLTLTAPPVERIERRYALDEIRFSEPLRERMPRVDIDTVNFDTGSWEITPDQTERLAFVAQGVKRAVQRNPREVFLVEGYTDAVGNDVDNLSLSDRRAESVAVTLTDQFGVPAENLSTQGYGKQFLKIPTEGPERVNRRVAVRRITPLLLGQN